MSLILCSHGDHFKAANEICGICHCGCPECRPGMAMIFVASSIAMVAHRGQRREALDEEYIAHPARVAENAKAAGLPPEAIAAAWLHDVVEDTGFPGECLRRGFPGRVADLVMLLTHGWGDHGKPSAEEKAHYYAGIKADPDALTIKLLDRADNLRDFAKLALRGGRDRKWASNYYRKTLADIDPLVEFCANGFAIGQYMNARGDLAIALATSGKTP